VGVANGSYQVEDIFGFDQTGIDGEGNAVGEFYATGYKPQCLSRLKAAGIELPAGIFEARRVAVK
jgi:pilus assembly protein CpaF